MGQFVRRTFGEGQVGIKRDIDGRVSEGPSLGVVDGAEAVRVFSAGIIEPVAAGICREGDGQLGCVPGKA